MTHRDLRQRKLDLRGIASLRNHSLSGFARPYGAPPDLEWAFCGYCGEMVTLDRGTGDAQGRALEQTCEAIGRPLRPLVVARSGGLACRS